MAKSRAELLLVIKQQGKKALTAIRDGIKNIGVVAGAAATAITGFVGVSVAKFREQELSVNKLNQSLVRQGIFTKELSQRYQENASELQKLTTFGDEAIISAQAQLQAYLGQEEITKELTATTLDFASAMGVDLKTASDLIGKTIGSSTNALSRYGIEVDTSGTKQEKMTQVMQALNQRFGGQAEAAAKGLGSLTQMQNALGDLQEVIGKQVAPLITFLARRITTFAENAQKGSPALEAIGDIFGFIVKAGLGVKFVLKEIGQALGIVVGVAVETVGAIAGGQFSRAAELAGAGIDQLKESSKANLETFQAEMLEIDALGKEQQALQNDEFRRLEEQSDINAKENEKIRQAEQDKVLLEQQKKARQKRNAEIAKLDQNLLKLGIQANSQRLSDQQSTFGRIATLTNSNNKTLAALGRAAAIANITISTAQGIGKALGAFPPPLSFALAGLVGAAGAAQIATVKSTRLADGGIVSATPGGIQATIGEGGQDEAVIPLDDPDAPLLGGMTVNFTGPVLGDPAQAREFAIMVDRELRVLRQNNESESFETRL